MAEFVVPAPGPGVPRRIGRPPGKAADTKRRILDVARVVFAERGFDSATNKDIADVAGITAAALYYHFSSKAELYLAVYDDTQNRIYAQFGAAMERHDSFYGKLEAILATAHALNRADPSLALFASAVRVDARRHPEMFEGPRPGGALRESFLATLVGAGIRSGEIDSCDAPQITAFLMATLVGLNDAMSDDLVQHQRAIDGILGVVAGRLVRGPR
jgi:AcrR family transcriptional regulator